MSKGEREYAAEDGDGKVFRAISPGHDIHEYTFDGPAYLGFPHSFDVFGDGSLVIAFAGGHTTGSVVVFVTVPSGKRFAFIGDIAWQYDGIRHRVERPWLHAGPDPGRTGKTVGLDKTTLMSQLDPLEEQSLIVRRPDPRDRIPGLTTTGDARRAQVAAASANAESEALSRFTADDIHTFRRILVELIGDSADPGSCL